ncbi:MAG: hypothetical protein ACOX3R_09315 [Desulfitobacteriia bacterium]|jgi:hypothetical protein
MRGLLETFLNDLKNGILTEILERVKADATLDLEIRENYINIYYRGGNALKIIEKSASTYEFSMDTGYIVDSELKANLERPQIVNNASSVSEWLKNLPVIKDQMDLYFGRNSKEREYQQVVVLENNYGSTANDTDYYICDIEYANPNGRFDMVAVKWPSTAPARKRTNNLDLAFIEMKYMDKALTGPSGLKDHIKGMLKFLSNPQNLASIKEEMVKVFKQKVQLGLLQGIKEIESFSDRKPEYIFILANHDPAKTALYRELDQVINSSVYQNFCQYADLKFAAACFMGYGLYLESIQEVHTFMSQNTHLLK